MSKGILWTIKIVVVLVVILFMIAAKEIGIPIIVKNLIGFAIIYAVWKYKPDEPTNSDNNQQLDKS